MALQAPTVNGRPPDHPENAPPSTINIHTEAIIKATATHATIDERSKDGTMQKIATQSPLRGSSTGGQNQEILIHQMDSPPQQTPNHVVSGQHIEPLLNSDQMENSGNPATTINILPTVQPPPKEHDHTNTIHTEQFPPLTANLEPPNKTRRSSTQDQKMSNSGGVRQNASVTPQPHHIPSIKQLTSKFNPFTQHAGQITQTNSVHNVVENAGPMTDNALPYTTRQLKVSSNFDKFNDSRTPHSVAPRTISTATPIVSLQKEIKESRNFNIPIPTPQPPNVVPSYAARFKATQAHNEQKIDLSPPKITTKQGFPAVLFKREDFMVKLAEKCRFTVVGKFSNTMPKMEIIRRSLTSQLQINGSCKVTHFNSKHVYIDLDNEIDHRTVWNKERIFIEGMPMRLFVWTPTFKPEEETPMAPVWVVLPQLPWHCYRMEFVSKLLEPVGRVLFFDAASLQKTRGSVAKVKIEIDITKPRVQHVWLGFPEEDGDVFGDGKWQELEFENVPEYCDYCKHQGHSNSVCIVRMRDEEYAKKKEEQAEIDNHQNHKNYSEKIKPQIQQPNNIPPDKGQSSRQPPSVNKQGEGQANNQWHTQRKKGNRGTLQVHTVKQVYVPIQANEINAKESQKKLLKPVQSFHVDVDGTVSSRNSFDALKIIDDNSVPQIPHGESIIDGYGGVKENMKSSVNLPLPTGSERELGEIYHMPTCTLNLQNASAEVAALDPVTTVAVKQDLRNNILGTISERGGVAPERLSVVGSVIVPQTHSVTATCSDNVPFIITDSAQGALQLSQPVKPSAHKNTSTKVWILKSFYGNKHGDEKNANTIQDDNNTVIVGEQAFHQQTCNEDEGHAVEIANDTAAATAADIDQVLVSQHTCATAGTTAHNSKENPRHTKKKQRNNSVQAKLKALHDARLAKLNEENPRTDSVQNRQSLSIHSQLKQYAGYEHDPDVIFLGDMFNDCLEGNTLTPTPQLEIMCNEASKVMKIAGQSNWNLNAQPFTPNAIPTQGIPVATESIDFKKAEPNDVATETDFKKSDTALVQPKRVQPSRSSRSKSYRGKG